jgi:NAD(P)-dependent dehydrogenase (short-subunit alcohol dehydrogenase family)
VSSISATNHTGHIAYVSAKAALNGYVVALGRRVAGHNVVVNAIEPGPIAVPGRYLTQLQERGGPAWDDYTRNHLPIGRLASPDDLAPFVALLCSPLAAYAAGAVINVDGGSS